MYPLSFSRATLLVVSPATLALRERGDGPQRTHISFPLQFNDVLISLFPETPLMNQFIPVLAKTK